MKQAKRALCLALAVLAALAMLAGCGKKAPEYTAQQILDAVKAAYGESYLPNTPIEREMLEFEFGLDMALVEDMAAEMPMIGFHPDRVIIVKAKSGEGAAVESAFKTARENMINNGIFYPANLPKINASQVVRNGDYVAFLLVGAADDVSATEEEMAQFALNEVQKAVEAFNALFK
ncbi:MAG: DUF4358 domain-containing protein [Clostridia bacterium]|nr:DUF4358 domain-containing protein [Clostridia bacterium]